MVRITEELVRKRSEHNEGLIGTLEELSLHQEDVEKIEHLNNWCKHLEILYLQANIISKIENVNKLKKLKYLNLALNNIEQIENLERCESLEKLDLTLNFIGKIDSVKTLQYNLNLKELYLTGNPCAEYEGYRDYVIAHLPQLHFLDTQEITKSERIQAQQNLPEIEKTVKVLQQNYLRFRETQRQTPCRRDDLTDEEFWQSKSAYSPEVRVEIAQRNQKIKREEPTDEPEEKKSVRLFNNEGRPLNINQAKLNFRFNDDDPQYIVLDIAIYKFLDTNLIEVDLQPIFVRVTVKGKVFQIVFAEEIYPDKSTAQRSEITGHLVIKMQKVNYCAIKFVPKKVVKQIEKKKPKREYLEIEEQPKVDLFNIVQDKKMFEDNLDVPPLEFG